MTARSPSINVMEHPVGDITDHNPHKTGVNSGAEDISIALTNIPAAANITFHIKLLNLTASQQSLFTIDTLPYSAIDINETQSLTNMTLHLFPPSEATIIITYIARDRRMVGEFLQVVYTGKSLESQTLIFKYVAHSILLIVCVSV